MPLCGEPEEVTPADEEGFRFACLFDDLTEDRGKKVRVNKKTLAIFLAKVDGRTRVYAMSNRCGHQGYPLSEGKIEVDTGKPVAVCPGHGYHYDCKTGFSLESNGAYRQQLFKVKKKGTEVWVKA